MSVTVSDSKKIIFLGRWHVDYQVIAQENFPAVKIMLSRCNNVYFFFLTCGCQPKSKSNLLYEKDLSASRKACDADNEPTAITAQFYLIRP